MQLNDSFMERFRAAESRANAGDFVGADEICTRLRDENPLDEGLLEMQYAIHCLLSEQRFPGPDYFAWLAWFHSRLKPRTYMEIGVASGESLQFAAPPTLAVGIDPAMKITFPQQTWIKLFKLESDAFFAQQQPKEVFGGDIDLAFIDGLHTYDQTLRDFINVERHAHSNTVILIHDILPFNAISASRERRSVLWLGDTWKIMILLRKYRPDLNIFTIPTYPSGLAVVTGLDPASVALHEQFDALCREADGYEFDAHYPGMAQHANVTANDFSDVARLLGSTA